MSGPVLKIEGLCKEFGVTKANRDISLEVMPGEVRGLAGENGSGKSTLVSIISGIYQKTSGTMVVDGVLYQPSNPMDAHRNHIGMVVQEMGLVNDLSLELNLFLNDMKQFEKFGVVNVHRLHRKAVDSMERWGFHNLPLSSPAVTNSIEVRKQVELVRALSCDPKILILDEVTQSLSHNNRNLLYKIIQQCKEQGIAVLIISHDLEELIHITDTITVLRDGAVVGTRGSENLDSRTLKQMMVGRELSGDYYRTDNSPNYSSDIALTVSDLTSEESGVEHISFDLHQGEILACCGLSDGGIHELGKTVFGLMRHKTGTVVVNKTGKQIKSAADAVQNGIAYVPKDRDTDGIMLGASIRENMILPAITNIKKKLGYLSERQINECSNKAVADFDVKCTGIAQVIGNLSGGNKQKVNLGRWISKGADIFILDCPTRGVDVSVKAYIYHVLRELKEKGIAILMISDELPEAIGMADRILIMSRGQIKQIISRGEEFNESNIIEVMI